MRGLFIADRRNGIIWLIRPAKPIETPPQAAAVKQPVVEATSETVTIDDVAQKDPLVRDGSRITEGSQIKSGSTLIDKWKAEKEKRREESRQRRKERQDD
jgi:hypothetical protein